VARPLPELPDWVAGLPLVGPRIAAEWQKLTTTSADELAASVTPYLTGIATWLIARAGGVGTFLLQFLLTVVVASLLYARGEAVASGVLAFARRLAGDDGVRVTVLSAGAIRAVALGIVVTALVQGIVGGIGLALTGVPSPTLLTCIMITLGVAQIGPAPVLAGGVVWLFVQGQPYWATVLIGWGLLTMSLDNVLRPILIRRGADLPLLLIIAVAYTLLIAWVRAGDPGQAVPQTVGDS
jgi:predicted PurR-regulated permease PerM